MHAVTKVIKTELSRIMEAPPCWVDVASVVEECDVEGAVVVSVVVVVGLVGVD